jgi:glucose-6-phosphate 1-dehydrogenase
VTATEVVVALAYPPQMVFGADKRTGADHFRFRLGPDVVIALGARAKQPGEAMRGEPTELKFMHQRGDEMDEYERLIGDAMVGDATLFARQDSAEAQWRIVEPVLDCAVPLDEYDRGTWGPAEAADIAEGVGGWHDLLV